MYNCYLGKNSLNFFSEENKTLRNGCRLVTLALVLWGSLQDLGTIFGLANVTMGLLALVYLTALALLFKVDLCVMYDFDGQLGSGVERPVFDSGRFADLDVDHDVWKFDDLAPGGRVTAK